jgi:thioester reductase-like protein
MNQDLAFGYTMTKWASEWVLWKAQEAGIPLDIYRLGQISGHSVTGENNLTRLILGVIAMKAAPKLKNQHEMLPVDFIAKAIVALSKRTYQHAEGWNIVNSKQVCYEDLFIDLKNIGYEIEMLPNNEWRKKLVTISEQNPLFPLISYYDVDENIEFVEVECKKTLNALQQLGIILPEDSEEMLKKHLAFWQKQDFNCL